MAQLTASSIFVEPIRTFSGLSGVLSARAVKRENGQSHKPRLKILKYFWYAVEAQSFHLLFTIGCKPLIFENTQV